MFPDIFNNKSLPRGIRNNNPCNLRLTGETWLGKIPNKQNTDRAFEQFKTPYYGFRAAAKDILNDYKLKGKTTVRLLISEFAPPSENDTIKYMNGVAKELGINVDTRMTYPFLLDNISKWLYRSHIKENGKEYFTHTQIRQHIDAAKLT